MAASATPPIAPVRIALLAVLLLLPLLPPLLPLLVVLLLPLVVLALPLLLPPVVLLLLLPPPLVLPVIVTGLRVIPPSLQLLINAKKIQFSSSSVIHTSRPTIHETLCIGSVQTTVFDRNTTVKTGSELLADSGRADTGKSGAGLGDLFRMKSVHGEKR